MHAKCKIIVYKIKYNKNSQQKKRGEIDCKIGIDKDIFLKSFLYTNIYRFVYFDLYILFIFSNLNFLYVIIR